MTHPFSEFSHFFSFKLGSIHWSFNIRLYQSSLNGPLTLPSISSHTEFILKWTRCLIEIWVTNFRIANTVSALKVTICNVPHPVIIQFRLKSISTMSIIINKKTQRNFKSRNQMSIWSWTNFFDILVIVFKIRLYANDLRWFRSVKIWLLDGPWYRKRSLINTPSIMFLKSFISSSRVKSIFISCLSPYRTNPSRRAPGK